MALTQVSLKSDWIGMLASGLCLVHCLVTPFLFMANASIGVRGETHPFWWGILDIIFLVLALLAVFWSIQKSGRSWVKYGFVIVWLLLAFIVFNEKFGLFQLAEEAIYPPTLGLIFLHFYNHRYCACANKSTSKDD